MALSNMKAEPKREWTEQAIGLAVLVLYILLDYEFARWAERAGGVDSQGNLQIWWQPMMLAGAVGSAILFFVSMGLWYFSHFIGEQVCAFLKRGGLDPRPAQRYMLDYYGRRVLRRD